MQNFVRSDFVVLCVLDLVAETPACYKTEDTKDHQVEFQNIILFMFLENYFIVNSSQGVFRDALNS